MQGARSGLIFRITAIAVGYFALAAATISSTRFGSGVAFIWVANAWLLAELSITPRRNWAWTILACALASFVATSLFGFGIEYAFPLAIINIAEAILGALILRVLKPGATKFDSLGALFFLFWQPAS